MSAEAQNSSRTFSTSNLIRRERCDKKFYSETDELFRADFSFDAFNSIEKREKYSSKEQIPIIYFDEESN